MSLNNIIPANLLLEYAHSIGVYSQLPLFKTPPMFKIAENYLCSVNVEFQIEVDTDGKFYKTMSSTDHPSFSKLRTYLSKSNYIQMNTSVINGDIVLNEFFLNGKLFEIGEQFPCGTAMKLHLKYKETNFSKNPFFTEFSKNHSAKGNFNWWYSKSILVEIDFV